MALLTPSRQERGSAGLEMPDSLGYRKGEYVLILARAAFSSMSRKLFICPFCRSGGYPARPAHLASGYSMNCIVLPGIESLVPGYCVVPDARICWSMSQRGISSRSTS